MIAILIFLIFPALLELQKESIATDNLVAHFTSTVEQLKQQNSNTTALYANNFDSLGAIPLLNRTNLVSEAAGDQNYILYISKGDSLIFWSDNSIFPGNIPFLSGVREKINHEHGTWYLIDTIKRGSYTFTGITLLFQAYKIRNEYLTDHWNPSFSIAHSGWILQSLDVAKDSGYRKLLRKFGDDQISTYEPPEHSLRSETFFLIVLFYTGAGALLFFIVFLLFMSGWNYPSRNIRILIFLFIVFLLRSIQYHFRFPGMLYSTGLFSPAFYSSPNIAASLGDLLLNSSLGLIVVLVFFRYGEIKNSSPTLHSIRNHSINVFLISFLLFSHICSGVIIKTLVLNSTVPLNFQVLSAMLPESGYSIFVILLLIAINWLLTIKIISSIQNKSNKIQWYAEGSIALLPLAFLVFFTPGLSDLFIPFVVTGIVLFCIMNIWHKQRSCYSFTIILLMLFYYASFATLILNQQNHAREQQKTDLLALRLSKTRNPVTEFMYEQASERIKTDRTIRHRIQNAKTVFDAQEALNIYMRDTCFGSYWEKYHLQLTLCDKESQLKIQPEAYLENCNRYFEKLQHDFGDSTGINTLTYIDLGAGKEYYLGVIPINIKDHHRDSAYTLYIEMSLDHVLPGTGYPGLLINATAFEKFSTQGISYAFYSEGHLQHAYGLYQYPFELKILDEHSSDNIHLFRNRIVHIMYPISEGVLVISSRNASILTRLAPFSYIFLLLSLITLTIAAAINLKIRKRVLPGGFRYRFYIAISAIIVLSIIIAGSFQIRNIVRMNDQMEREMLREKVQSVRVELQHKLAGKNTLGEVSDNDLDDLLLKFSNVFFTDINFYDKSGRLRSSSRPEIFEQRLISELMNRQAMIALIDQHASFFIHTEQIGNMKFNSAYLPVYNNKNQLLGYVNLPYFIHKDTSKQEITSTLVAYINIYILLIVAGIIFSLLISNYFTAPLTLLSEKLAGIRLGKLNEKITWTRDDEIGQLVIQYNSMVDELAESAEQLARSERETAWKEMARQVAHEIKNPLTPMKLSVQYLQKAWDEQSPDIEQRLKNFTGTMIEQIDHLSEIATGFSDFARLNRVQKEIVSPGEIIRSVLNLYKESSGIQFSLMDNAPGVKVFAGRSPLSRVFTNLFNNALQAIGERQDGEIVIRLEKEKQHLVIEIKDNGNGISARQQEKIFQPDFTTKTSGTGLGLAIVKAIIEENGGDVAFTSEENNGTTFYLRFPVYEG